MDAVRRFIKDWGGSIDVILHASEGEMIPFTLELKLPLAAAEPKAHEDQLTTEGILGWLPGSFPFNSHRDKKQNSDGLV